MARKPKNSRHGSRIGVLGINNAALFCLEVLGGKQPEGKAGFLQLLVLQSLSAVFFTENKTPPDRQTTDESCPYRHPVVTPSHLPLALFPAL